VKGLPRGWTEARIGDLCDLKNGRAFKPSEWSTEGLPIVRIQNLNDPRASFNRFSGEFEDRYHLRGGELLFAWSGTPGTSFGAHIWRGGEALLNQHIFRVDFDSQSIDKRFFRHAINQKLDELIDIAHGGVGLRHVNKGVFEGTKILVPPRNEQGRLADALDSVLARVKACRERLGRVPLILKRFREAVLEAAVTGRLTEEWRASASLSQTAEQQVSDRERSKSGRLRVRNQPRVVDNLHLGVLPASWSWVQNHRLAQDIENAICAGPFGTIFKAKDFRPQGVPIIFLRHVAPGQFLRLKPGFMDERVWRELHQAYSVYGGELLVTKLGDPPGTACIYPEGEGVAMVTPDVMKMSVDGSVASTRYLMHFFNSPVSKRLLEELAFGVTRLRIDLTMFKSFPIPLPTIEEQQEIVRRVDEMFDLTDALGRRRQNATSRLEMLTPSLLTKAFRGELVPQDPADEPANVLLERVRKGREADGEKARREKGNGANGEARPNELRASKQRKPAGASKRRGAAGIRVKGSRVG
jgi:type I restriction enzyme, S subunit